MTTQHINSTIVDIGNYTNPITISGSSVGSYTFNRLNTSERDTITYQSNVEFKQDVKVDGHSLNDFMKSVKDRLLLLDRNVTLESRWDELRVLGEQYKALEQECMRSEEFMKRLTE